MNIWTFPEVTLVFLIIAYFAEAMWKDQADKGGLKDKKGEEHEVEIEEHEVEMEEHEVEMEEHEVEIEEHEVEIEEGEEHEVKIEEGEEHKEDKEDNEEDHEENEDDPIGTDTYNPMSPSQHQLTTVEFESNKFGKLSTLLMVTTSDTASTAEAKTTRSAGTVVSAGSAITAGQQLATMCATTSSASSATPTTIAPQSSLEL